MFNFLKKKVKPTHNDTLSTEEKTVESEVVQKPSMEISESNFAMPIDGKIIPLTEVPDQVFAQGMMGQGIAIAPTGNTVYSPIDGKIVSIFPTKHAIGLVTDTGVEILIHVGVDTVKLKGQGFDQLTEDGQVVKRGDALLKIDLAYIEANAPSSIIPIIFTNLTTQKVNVLKDGIQQHGETGILSIH